MTYSFVIFPLISLVKYLNHLKIMSDKNLKMYEWYGNVYISS